MYGYIIAGILALVVVAFLFAGMAQAKPDPGRSGKVSGHRPVQHDAPAADEPTPDRSVTANPAKIRQAREHTPPA